MVRGSSFFVGLKLIYPLAIWGVGGCYVPEARKPWPAGVKCIFSKVCVVIHQIIGVLGRVTQIQS